MALTCPSCRVLNWDTARFCTNCGTPLAPAYYQAVMGGQASPFIPPPPGYAPPRRHPARTLLLLLLLLLLACAGGAAAAPVLGLRPPAASVAAVTVSPSPSGTPEASPPPSPSPVASAGPSPGPSPVTTGSPSPAGTTPAPSPSPAAGGGGQEACSTNKTVCITAPSTWGGGPSGDGNGYTVENGPEVTVSSDVESDAGDSLSYANRLIQQDTSGSPDADDCAGGKPAPKTGTVAGKSGYSFVACYTDPIAQRAMTVEEFVSVGPDHETVYRLSVLASRADYQNFVADAAAQAVIDSTRWLI